MRAVSLKGSKNGSSCSWKLGRELLLLGILLAAIWVPRGLQLGKFVTADEPLWLERSANFYCALSKGALANTFQREHPGVTTMWAGTLGFLWQAPDYKLNCPDAMGREGHEVVFRARDLNAIDLLTGGRFFIVLGITLVLGLVFLYARHLFGIGPAFVGVWLVALDPFFLAHSRLLHLDGLLSSFMLLSLLAFTSYLRWRRRRDLIVSGLVAGLSWLAKSPGFFLIPFVGMLALIDSWKLVNPCCGLGIVQRNTGGLGHKVKGLFEFMKPLVTWCVLGALVFFTFWPAMWVDPVGTLSQVFDLATEYAGEGHGNALLFNGMLIDDGRLGAEFFYFYPLTYLWRATPVTLFGLLAAIFAFIFKLDLLAPKENRQTGIALALFVILFTIFMSLGTKKFDRYLLPVYPVLDLIAGVGWISIVNWLKKALFSKRLTGNHTALVARILPLVLLGVVFCGQLLVAWLTFPYYFSYYNPLMGGSRKAPEVMQIGWGEGLDQAARYLNEKQDAEALTVFSWYETGCFSYLFKGISHQIPTQYAWDQDEIADFFAADYVVVYIHQWQRKMAEHLLDYLSLQVPEHSIWINGLEYARIYRLSSNRDFYTDPSYQRMDARFGEGILLEGESVPVRQAAPEDTLLVALSWRAEAEIVEHFKVFVHLLDDAGNLVAQDDAEPMRGFAPTDRWKQGQQVADHYGVHLPPDLQPGIYHLQMGMYRLFGERLPVQLDGQVIGDALPIGDIEVVIE